MFLKRQRQLERDETTRQRAINYKRFFSSQEGKEILFDLMNRYHILNSHGGDALKEGQRSVVLYILSEAHVDLDQLDKILKGELNV